MKKTMFAILFCIGRIAAAQTTHSATLNWIDSDAGVTFNVYRASGLCSGSPAFSKMASGVAVKTYLDSTVTPGNYCYYVTATFNGVESAASNMVGPLIPVFVPTGLTATSQ